MKEDWRERIYRSYLNGCAFPIATDTIDGLASCIPYLNSLVCKHFPPIKQAPILELGCGYGALIYVARNLGYTNMHGVDRSPDQVERARKLGIVGVEQGDAMETLRVMREGALSAVVAFDVIEHLDREVAFAFA